MPFGLKNVGPIYQRLVIKMYKQYISSTVEVYIDDMVVKNKVDKVYLDNLKEVFDILKKYKMRLNDSKCVFGGNFRKVLRILGHTPRN